MIDRVWRYAVACDFEGCDRELGILCHSADQAAEAARRACWLADLEPVGGFALCPAHNPAMHSNRELEREVEKATAIRDAAKDRAAAALACVHCGQPRRLERIADGTARLLCSTCDAAGIVPPPDLETAPPEPAALTCSLCKVPLRRVTADALDCPSCKSRFNRSTLCGGFLRDDRE